MNIRKIIALRSIIDASTKTLLRAIHKERTHNLPKKQHFLIPGTYKYLYTYQGFRNVTFSVNFAYVLYGWLLTVCNTYSFLRKEIKKKNKSFFALVSGAYCSLISTNFKTQVILAQVTEKARTLFTTNAEFIGNVNQAESLCRLFFIKFLFFNQMIALQKL